MSISIRKHQAAKKPVIGQGEIGEILIDVRDVCNSQGLEKTGDALRTALYVLYYEIRVNSGQLKLPRQNSKGEFVAKEPEPTDLTRFQKLAKFRETKRS